MTTPPPARGLFQSASPDFVALLQQRPSVMATLNTAGPSRRGIILDDAEKRRQMELERIRKEAAQKETERQERRAQANAYKKNEKKSSFEDNMIASIGSTPYHRQRPPTQKVIDLLERIGKSHLLTDVCTPFRARQNKGSKFRRVRSPQPVRTINYDLPEPVKQNATLKSHNYKSCSLSDSDDSDAEGHGEQTTSKSDMAEAEAKPARAPVYLPKQMLQSGWDSDEEPSPKRIMPKAETELVELSNGVEMEIETNEGQEPEPTQSSRESIGSSTSNSAPASNVVAVRKSIRIQARMEAKAALGGQQDEDDIYVYEGVNAKQRRSRSSGSSKDSGRSREDGVYGIPEEMLALKRVRRGRAYGTRARLITTLCRASTRESPGWKIVYSTAYLDVKEQIIKKELSRLEDQMKRIEMVFGGFTKASRRNWIQGSFGGPKKASRRMAPNKTYY